MKTEKRELKIRYYISNKENNKLYSASSEEIKNPKYRSAKPANVKNKYGYYQNDGITAFRAE